MKSIECSNKLYIIISCHLHQIFTFFWQMEAIKNKLMIDLFTDWNNSVTARALCVKCTVLHRNTMVCKHFIYLHNYNIHIKYNTILCSIFIPAEGKQNTISHFAFKDHILSFRSKYWHVNHVSENINFNSYYTARKSITCLHYWWYKLLLWWHWLVSVSSITSAGNANDVTTLHPKHLTIH